MDGLSDYYYDRLQRLIRHPEYLEDIKNVKFDDNGFEIPERERDINVDAIRDKWQLDTLISSSITLSKYGAAALPIFRQLALVSVEYCRTEREMTDDEKAVANGRYEPQCTPCKGDEVEVETILEITPIIWDEHFIKLTIDVSPDGNLESILDQVRKHVSFAREMLSNKARRHHFEKRAIYYRVWDLRKEKMPFKQISRKLDIQEEDAKRYFYAAYNLIFGRPFDKDKWHKILSELLRLNVWKADIFDEQAANKYLAHEEPSRQIKIAPIIDDVTAGVDEGFNALAYDLKNLCKACDDNDCKEKAIPNILNNDFSEFAPCPEFIAIAQTYR